MSYESEEFLKPPIFVFAKLPTPLVVSVIDDNAYQVSSENHRDVIVVSQAHVRVETNIFIPYVAIFL